jgi:hypothetical protein
VREEVASEDAGPGAIEQTPAFLPEVAPGVEQVAGLVVTDGNHADIMVRSWSFGRLFAGPSTFGYSSCLGPSPAMLRQHVAPVVLRLAHAAVANPLSSDLLQRPLLPEMPLAG